jgi:hypothetical protein
MDKGARVVINQQLAGYPAGTRGRVIRVDERFFGATRYSVMLDEDAVVLEELTEDHLFALDQDDV